MYHILWETSSRFPKLVLFFSDVCAIAAFVAG